MRTIESWTDGDEAYDVWIKKPIRQCQVEVSQYNYNQSYQVGDFLIFSRTGSENEEYSLQNTYENVNWNELKGSQGSAKKYQQFECEAMDNYKIAKHNHKAIICLEFTQNVSSYAYYKAQGK